MVFPGAKAVAAAVELPTLELLFVPEEVVDLAAAVAVAFRLVEVALVAEAAAVTVATAVGLVALAAAAAAALAALAALEP
jgi:hypothetical protein